MKIILLFLLGFVFAVFVLDQFIQFTREPFDPDNCREYRENG